MSLVKSVAVIILVVFLLNGIIQPLIETSNVLKEKIALGAAILSSCRAARNNALMDDYMRDLNANIDEAAFKQYFAEAFCQTLELDLISPAGGGDMVFSSSSGRFEPITVSLTLNAPTDLYFTEREVITAQIALSTPYVFRTSLLKQAFSAMPPASHRFLVTETRVFEVQIIN